MSKKNYVLMTKDRSGGFKPKLNSHGNKTTFVNRQPRGAALKAATRSKSSSFTDIFLKETNVHNRIHHFKGKVTKVRATDGYLEMTGLPDGTKVNKSVVKKVALLAT